MKKGSVKQDAFVAAYIKHLHHKDACKRAAEEAGLNYNYCRQLLTKPNIIEQIEEAKRSRIERVEADADLVLRDLIAMHQADVRQIYNEETGDLKPVAEWPDSVIRMMEISGAMVEGEPSSNFVFKIRPADRLKVIEMIGKHINVQAFKEKVEHDVSDGLADKILAARRRLRKES